MKFISKITSFGCLALFALIFASTSQAQTLRVVYPVKVVCGFVEGNVPPLSSSPVPNHEPRGYEDLKPGNYATNVNIFHADMVRDSLDAYVQLPGRDRIFLGPFDSSDFEATAWDCRQLAPALGLTAGRPFDGWLLLFANRDGYEISAVYTYESQNGFWDRGFFEVGPGAIRRLGVFPSIPNWFQPNPPIPSTRAVPWLSFLPQGIATPANQLPGPATQNAVISSAMGGLGLGASIDVERALPRTLAEPIERQDLRLSGVEPPDIGPSLGGNNRR